MAKQTILTTAGKKHFKIKSAIKQNGVLAKGGVKDGTDSCGGGDDTGLLWSVSAYQAKGQPACGLVAEG